MADRKVLLVGWQGADYQTLRSLLEKGLLPQLQKALDQGTFGALADLSIRNSTIDWATLTTGKNPHDHEVLSSVIHDLTNGKTLPTPHTIRCAPALWNFLSEKKLLAHVVGGPLTSPAEEISGVFVSQEFIDFKANPDLREENLNELIKPSGWKERFQDLRLTALDIDPRLLGLLIPMIAEVPQTRDDRPQMILHHLAELYTAHNILIRLLHSETPWRFITVSYPFIERLFRHFGRFSEQQPQNSDYERRIYGDVLNAAYRILDLLLSDLLKETGPGTTIVLTCTGTPSDSTSKPSSGMFVAAGPGINAGKKIQGARLIDIVPTLLHAFNLPVDEKMEGRVLEEIFGEKTSPRTTSYWKINAELKQKHRDGTRQHRKPTCPIDPLPREDIAIQIERETLFNRGISLLSTGKSAEALPFLFRVAAERPENLRYNYYLARALSTLDLFEEAIEVIAVAEDNGSTEATIDFKVQIALETWNLPAARRFLKEAEELNRESASFYGYKGYLALLDKRAGEAEIYFRKSLSKNPKNGLSWAGLSSALLRLKKPFEALNAAKEAVSLQSENHLTQRALAEAAEAAGARDLAALAHADALRLKPDLLSAREGLLRLALSVSEKSREEVFARLSRRNQKSLEDKNEKIRLRNQFRRLREEFAKERRDARQKTIPLFGYDFNTASIPENKVLNTFQTITCESYEIRLLWLDELARVLDFVADADIFNGQIFPLIALRHGSDRIVAAGILQKSGEKRKEARFILSIRKRYCNPAFLNRFINVFDELAASCGIRKLSITVPASLSWRKELSQSGFRHVRTDEWVSISTRTEDFRKKTEAAARAARWARNRMNFATEAFDPNKHAKEVHLILQSHNLLSLFQEPTVGYSLDLSAIVIEADKIVGVILVIDLGQRIFVRARAVALTHQSQSKSINALLMDHLLGTLAKNHDFRNVEHLLFTARPDRHQESLTLYKYHKVERIESYLRYEKKILPEVDRVIQSRKTVAVR